MQAPRASADKIPRRLDRVSGRFRSSGPPMHFKEIRRSRDARQNPKAIFLKLVACALSEVCADAL